MISVEAILVTFFPILKIFLSVEITLEVFKGNILGGILGGTLFWLKGFSCGELARLGVLAHLVEISPFLRSSYKYIMCSNEK